MKKNKALIFLLTIIVLTVSCYMIPSVPPVLNDFTVSIPLGDTTITVLQVSEAYPNDIQISNDTVYELTDTARWIRDTHFKDTIRIAINIEEMFPEDVIDTNRDSTYFSSTIDRIYNDLYIWGEVPYTTDARIKHMIYSRYNLVYQDTIDIFFEKTDALAESIKYTVEDFPFGDYVHNLELIIDSGQTWIDSMYGFSRIALKFQLHGDRVITLVNERELPFTPPDSSPLRMINYIRMNYKIWNRLPMESQLVIMLIDSLDNLVFNDTLQINAVPRNPDGTGIGEAAFSNFDIQLDNSLYDIFRYSTVKAKAQLLIPEPDEPNAFVLPTDSIKIEGCIEINADIDAELAVRSISGN